MTLNSAWGHDGVSYDGKEMRELVETLTGGLTGVTGGTSALKVSQQTVAAATVKVAEGGAIIPATGAGLGGSYQIYNDADLNSPTISPTAANGRKDRLIVRVTAGVPALEVVQGVASGSPAEPSITGDNYLELALITLPASTTNITDAMITDRRVRALWRLPHSYTANRLAGADNVFTNQTTYGAMPQAADAAALTLTVVKVHADTKLVVDLSASGWLNSGVAQKFWVGVHDGTTAYDVASQYFETTGTRHLPVSGHREILGLAAGTYTFTVRCKADTASEFHIDTGDRVSYTVTETF